MSETSTIEWTDATWNPITGCTLVSDGCRNCYAASLAATRLKHHPSRAGLARVNADGVAKFTGEVRLNEQWLDQPLRWRRPRMVFVCAHGDLFHEDVPDAWIDRVFAVMALCPQHTFQVLTKRPARMRGYLARLCSETDEAIESICDAAVAITGSPCAAHIEDVDLPLPNVWLGTSIEDQATADERIPHLLATPAALRFVSAEPLLGPVRLTRIYRRDGAWADALDGEVYYPGAGSISSETVQSGRRLDWVIVGGESGTHARPLHPDWARSLRDQCAAAGVPFFFKQWGESIDADQWMASLKASHGRLERAGRPDWTPSDPLNFEDAAGLGAATNIDRRKIEHLGDGRTNFKLGKARTGHLLDGVTHHAMPEPAR